MKAFFIFSFSVILTSCSTTCPSFHTGITDYKNVANELLKRNAAGHSLKVKSLAQNLVEQSVQLMEKYSSRKPQCKAFLTEVISHKAAMLSSSLEEIESKYHEGSALSKPKDDHCYEAKELMVHPATVVILTREYNKENQEQINDEIEEVLSHIDEL